MIREWMNDKMTRIRSRFESDDGNQQSSSATAVAVPASNQAVAKRKKHRSSSSTATREQPMCPRTELILRLQQMKRKMSPEQSEYCRHLLRTTMDSYSHRHVIGEWQPRSENAEPCQVCFVRYGTLKCDPCTHGKICKYCAYQMLYCADFPYNSVVICTLCFRPVVGFTRKSTKRKVSTQSVECDDDEAPPEEDEHSISLHEYAMSMIETSKSACQDNKGYVHSKETSVGSL